MFEARLLEGSVFKQIIDSVKDFVTDANVNAAEEALRIQCMDSSHVALVDVQLQVEAFDHYRCDKPMCLGIKPPNIAKILKLMNKDDIEKRQHLVEAVMTETDLLPVMQKEHLKSVPDLTNLADTAYIK